MQIENREEAQRSILQMCRGAFQERVDYEMPHLMENIFDPNTAAKAKRKVTITLELCPDDTRQNIVVNCLVKTTLAPSNPATTMLYAVDEHTVVEMVPQIPGQLAGDLRHHLHHRMLVHGVQHRGSGVGRGQRRLDQAVDHDVLAGVVGAKLQRDGHLALCLGGCVGVEDVFHQVRHFVVHALLKGAPAHLQDRPLGLFSVFDLQNNSSFSAGVTRKIISCVCVSCGPSSRRLSAFRRWRPAKPRRLRPVRHTPYPAPPGTRRTRAGSAACTLRFCPGSPASMGKGRMWYARPSFRHPQYLEKLVALAKCV